MTKHEHATGETPGTTGNERPDEPSAIPKDYTPDPYPGWRWNATTGEAKVINSLAEEETARGEGFTERHPPAPSNVLPGDLPPEINPLGGPAGPKPNHDLPPYRRPRIHDGD